MRSKRVAILRRNRANIGLSERPLAAETLEDRCVLAGEGPEPAAVSIETPATDSVGEAGSLPLAGSPYEPVPDDELASLIATDDLTTTEDPISADARSGPRTTLDFFELTQPRPSLPFPDGVDGIDPTVFSLERLSNEFMLFNDMRLTDDLQFVEDYGMAPLSRYTHWFFWNAGESDSGPVNVERTREFARRLDPRRLFVVNIESWPTTGSDAVIDASIAKFVQVLQIIREENPQLVMGLYRIPPNRDYSTPNNYDYGTPQFNAWTAGNARLQPIVDLLDVIMPSIYTFYPDYSENGSLRPSEYDRFIRYATTNLLEARQFGKPVLAYIWPYYHGGGGSTDPNAPDYRYWKFQPIGERFWDLVLETAYTYADGAIIYRGNESVWTPGLEWWTATQTFLAEIAAARPTAESTSFGTVAAGSMVDTRTDDLTSVRITINPVNDAPVARGDSIFMAENSAREIDVLADNGSGADSDVDGVVVPETVTVVLGVNHGTLENLGGSRFRYTPALNYQGTDRFTYQVRDDSGALSNTATVSIVVNSRPIARPDTLSTNEDTALTINVATSNGNGADSDLDGNLNALSAIVVQPPLRGTVSKNANGTFRYQPELNFFGTDTFTYRIFDLLGAASNDATVTITVRDVNDPPIARNDDFTMLEDDVLVLRPWDDNGNGADTDVDGVLRTDTFVVVTPPSQGRVVAVPGGWEYRPNDNYAGTDQFTYRIRDDDNALSGIATVRFTIQEVNDAPVAFDDFVLVQPNEPTQIDLSTPGAKTADYDLDDGLSEPYVLDHAAPRHGMIATLGGSLVVYTPDPGFVGRDEFSYIMQDLSGADSNMATVTVIVDGRPVAFADVASGDEDQSLIVNLLANNGFGRDMDPESSLRPSALVILSNPLHGTLTNLRDGRVRYLPHPDYFGTDTFTYAVPDGYLTYSNPATVTITVASRNDAPRTQPDQILTVVDLPWTFDPLADNGSGPDTDVDGTLDVSSLEWEAAPRFGSLVPLGGSSYRYVPTSGFVGAETVRYRIADELGFLSDWTEVRFEVRDANMAPLAIDDQFALLEDQVVILDLLADHGQGADIDWDGDLDPTSLQIVTSPNLGALTSLGDGRFEYRPHADGFGTDQFTYTVADTEGAVSNIAVVELTITPQNDPPRPADDQVTVVEDQTVEFSVLEPNGGAADVDIDSAIDPGSVVIAESPAHGNLVSLGLGRFRYQPAANYFGTDQWRYRVADAEGAQSELGTVTITITSQNDAPTAQPDLLQTDEDQAVEADLLADLGNGTDFDLDGTLAGNTLQIVASPGQGTVSLIGDGRIRYQPFLNFFGTDSFTYRVQDDLGAWSNPAEVTITVLPVNDAPFATDDRLTTPVGVPLDADLTLDQGFGIDTDLDGTIAVTTLQIQQSPAHGTALVLPNGHVRYTPTAGYTGLDSFTYTIADNLGLASNLATVQLVVNNPPNAAADTLSVVEDVPLEFGVTSDHGAGPDSDSDGQLVLTSVQIVDAPAHGQLVPLGEDRFRYIPAANFFGGDQFTYRIADDLGGVSNLATVTLQVAPVNDAPFAANDYREGLEGLPLHFSLIAENGFGADGDVEGELDAASIAITTGPTNGSVFVDLDGSVTYTPNRNFTGTETFQYRIYDQAGQPSNVAVVSILITAANLPPNSRPDQFVTDEDKSLTFNVLQDNGSGADWDPDGTLDLATIVNVSWPLYGSLTNLGNGSFRYTPYGNQFGYDTFAYTVRDNLGARSKSFEVLREGVDGATNTSRLEHEWTFNVSGSGAATFVINGYHDSEVEDFGFEYSHDGIQWTLLPIVVTQTAQIHRYQFPNSMQGTLYVRAVDLNRTAGELTLDRLYVDDLYVYVERAQDMTLPLITVANVTVNEDASGAPVAQFLVTRTGVLTGNTTVAYQTVAETAEAGVDFTSLSLRTVVFTPGQTQKTIQVPIINDNLAEGAETFRIDFPYIYGGRLAATYATGTILPSDQPPSGGSPVLASPESGTDGADEEEEERTQEPLRVLDLFVSSSAWPAAFQETLRAAGQRYTAEAPSGWRITGDDRATVTVPWANVDQLHIHFSQPMAAESDWGQWIAVSSAARGDLTADVSAWNYQADRQVLTLQFAQPLPADRYALVIRETAHDQDGNLLDGEWVAGQSDHSGDGNPGGHFRWGWSLLPADVDGNGIVNHRDSVLLLLDQRAALRSQQRAEAIRSDLDGDGYWTRYDSQVLGAIAARQLGTTPPPLPNDIVFSAPDPSGFWSYRSEDTTSGDSEPEPNALLTLLRQRRQRRAFS